ncbi:hypothetical protein [Cohnella soli]|uniref:Uncharacterized protein n=1 Tax=Cohnella soli TaxID=425005 RepID=A0ABW0HM69_9BACL
MIVGLYFCDCGESYVADVASQEVLCLKCHTSLKLVTDPSLKMLSRLENRQLEHLWKLFSKVSFDPSNEEITERFLCWLPTTNRFAIWLWFAKQYQGTFADLPGKLIWQEKGRQYANDCDCGQHVPVGQSCYFNEKHSKVRCDTCGKREMLDLWLLEGYRNPWIRGASDPEFDRTSFCFIDTVVELLEKFRHGNWSLGNAFVYKNLVFINQVNGGDEWMAIKDWCPFDSITFRAVLRHGDENGRKYIRKLLNYPIDDRSMPNYWLADALS